MLAFWVGLVWLLTVGFAYSYFWSASTLIYFLLRKDVDATEIEEVYIEEEEEEEEDFGFGEGEPADDAQAEEPADEEKAPEDEPADEEKPDEPEPEEKAEGEEEKPEDDEEKDKPD